MNEIRGRFFLSETVKKYDYWLIFLLSFLYIRWDLLWTGSGIGVLLFTLLFCGFFTFRLNSTVPISNENRTAARPWFLVILLSALACAWFDYSTLSWCGFLFLTIVFLYWSMVLSGKRLLPLISNYLPLELITSLIQLPFANFGRFFGAIFRTKAHREAVAAGSIDEGTPVPARESRRKVLHNLFLMGFTLIMLGPLLLIVLNLLAAADEGFMHMIADLIDGFFDLFDDVFSVRILEIAWQLLLTVPVACYLFGLLWAHTRPDHAKGWKSRDRVDQMISSFRFVPRIMIYTGLGVFSGIYLLFLGLQASHLFAALTGGLPESTTYSAFARQGFFELCAVAFINLMIMAGTWLIASRKQDDGSDRISSVLRFLLAFLSLQTILLVITAMVKMGLYIDTYGLTRLRVYTSWFMLWLLLIFAILGVDHFRHILTGNRSAAPKGRFAPAKALTVLTVVMFLALNYANVDGIIVRENIHRYTNGQMSLEELDIYGLIHLSDNAAMELLDYYEDTRDTVSTGRQAQLSEEVEQWIQLVEPDFSLPREKAHWTVTSMRLAHRLETLKSL